MAKAKSKKSKLRIINSKPKNLRKTLLITCLVAAVAVGIFFTFYSRADSGNIPTCGYKDPQRTKVKFCDQLEPKVAWWQNDSRQKNGINPSYVVLDTCLSNVARDWSEQMATRYGLVHMDKVKNWAGLVSGYCGSNWRKLGENIQHINPNSYPACTPGGGYSPNDCAWQIMINFFNSPLHKANMLDSIFTRQGVGIYHDAAGGLWITVEYWG